MHRSKITLIIFIFGLLNSSIRTESASEETDFDASGSNYDDCLKLLAEITLEAAELGVLVAAHDIVKVVPLALHLIKDVAKDIKCFKKHSEVVRYKMKSVSACVTNSLIGARGVLILMVSQSLFAQESDYNKLGERFKKVFKQASECINANSDSQKTSEE